CAGGAEGLLTQYVNRCIETFPEVDREIILKAMLALREPENNQRIAEGLTIDELAKGAGAENRRLQLHIDRLTKRDIRLIETVATSDDSAPRYRLPHERLIPATLRLTGKLLAEVEQAKLKFGNAFSAWKNNERRSRFLLKAGELRLIELYENQIPWGTDEQEKRNFLNLSRRQHTLNRIGMGLAIVALTVGAW